MLRRMKTMAINEISALIISMAPTISAVVGIIVSLVVGIKKIKASNNNVVEQLKADNEAAKAELLKSNKQIIEANAILITSNEQLKAENAKLKHDMHDIMAILKNVKNKEE